jgi:4-diphosphocytidyl-2-C-methyl-D-erythritol kinase
MIVPAKGFKALAPAKLNLTLEILGKRADGYHEIRTLMQPISLYDILWFHPANGNLEVYCPGYPELEREDNLIVRAVRLLEKEIGQTLALRIHLRKRIPLGGGLGGGSSDAATVLINLNRLLGDQVPVERLTVLAAQIGSDVPFFLKRQTALALGRGERILPWPRFPLWWYVLICPDFPVSTPWAYGRVKLPLTEEKETSNIGSLREWGEIPRKDQLKNDLEPGVFPVFPRLGEIKEALFREGCLQALMSGSGSTVFGIWEDQTNAAQAFLSLKNQGWGKVFLVRGI